MQGGYRFVQEVPQRSRGWRDENDIVKGYDFSERLVVCLEGRDTNGDLKFSPLYQSLPYSELNYNLEKCFDEINAVQNELYDDPSFDASMFGIHVFTGFRFYQSAREEEIRHRVRNEIRTTGKAVLTRAEALEF